MYIQNLWKKYSMTMHDSWNQIMTAFCHVSYVSSKEKQMASRIWQEISCPPSHRKGRDSPRPTRDRHAQLLGGSLRLRLRCRRRLPGSVRRGPSTTCPGDGGSSVENPWRIRGEQLINDFSGIWIWKILKNIEKSRWRWWRSDIEEVHGQWDWQSDQ